ncbi:polysaccharide biosynthesis/export family protein (plasmid) [Shinella sp. H4-D48]|uniref:polysaccharide biosynthesis/export family protein n=1 Tax=unclassified Shinella TaxID=2643062 RepID=UPI001F53A18E|nr:MULTISPECIES: polysaccharide biosynthesis/export family protein [unclassified Shinella]UNK40453.1 polysaccharide biosynthesis/export family protein [Shinella sp. H4-D48]
MAHIQAEHCNDQHFRWRSLLQKVCAFILLLVAAVVPAGAQGQDYKVTSGDVLRITVYGDPGLSGSFPIGTDGTIGYPLLGNVAVNGRPVEEVRQAIDAGLKEHIANLSVAVVVETYAPVFVVGEVQRPGRYEFRPGMIALELFALGGGQKEVLARGDNAGIQLAGLRQEYADLGAQLLGQDVKRVRLEAELNGQPFTYRPNDEIGTPDPRIVNQIVEAERTVFELRRTTLEAELKSLEQQRAGYVDEIETLEQSGKLRNGELTLLDEDVKLAQSMVARGLTSKTQLRDKQREISATNRDALEFGSFLARARQNLTVIDSRLGSLREQRRGEVAVELRELNIDILRLRRKMNYNLQAMAEAGIAIERKGGARQTAFRFSAVRLVDGKYREVPVGQTDAVRAGDILRVSLALDTGDVAER